jgi:hypothetical protein
MSNSRLGIRLPDERKRKMPEYVLLLHSTTNVFDTLSPEEIQRIIQRYSGWRASLAEKGHAATGKKLRDGTGRVMKSGAGKPVITDGPYTEAREIIGGFFAFTADSYDHAVELAGDCPHLQFGTIEIREVERVAAG